MSMSMLLSIRALVVVNLQCSILSSLHPARVSNKARKIKVRYKLATNPYQIAMSLLSAPPSQSLPARSSRRILSCGRKSSFMAFFSHHSFVADQDAVHLKAFHKFTKLSAPATLDFGQLICRVVFNYSAWFPEPKKQVAANQGCFCKKCWVQNVQ